eukprot:932993-Rhodomonas_salina.2
MVLQARWTLPTWRRALSCSCTRPAAPPRYKSHTPESNPESTAPGTISTESAGPWTRFRRTHALAPCNQTQDASVAVLQLWNLPSQSRPPCWTMLCGVLVGQIQARALYGDKRLRQHSSGYLLVALRHEPHTAQRFGVPVSCTETATAHGVPLPGGRHRRGHAVPHVRGAQERA